MRHAHTVRQTQETSISATLSLDGQGLGDLKTGIGFFDHMLHQLVRHSLCDLTLVADGDLHVDAHHTVEDTGLVLGALFLEALGDKKGITRYGVGEVPMDEALTRCVIDLSGRPFLVWNTTFATPKIGDFDTELVREFFQAFASAGRMTLHMHTAYGDNSHHIAESCFKACARALRQAIAQDPRQPGAVVSTKGVL